MLLFAINNGPVMTVGIPPLTDGVTLNVDRCVTNDALFTSEKLTSITIFA